MKRSQLSEEEQLWLRALMRGGGQIMPEHIARKLEGLGLLEYKVVGKRPASQRVLVLRQRATKSS